MKVILLQNINKVGKKDEIVEVAGGYADNVLFPSKKAIPATPKNVEALNRKISSTKALKELEHGLLESAIKSLPEETLTIKVKANEKGHLFSSIGEDEIVEALSQKRINLSTKNIVLAKPIKEIGQYKIQIIEGSYKKELIISITK
ncbi:MAG TPA: 50S ribosomal protein L9 [Candidatus Paceibacterota bacterium]|jgi:large subunit ribosomal protein L9|nr:50S ribosomal protein L9 [Candidatus Paceibacterota bacterium]